MTLQEAKNRRLQALKERNTDRVLVKPAAHHDQVQMPGAGTVAEYLIDALRHGCTTDQLEAETGWSRSTLMINLYKVAKRTGVGIRRSADMMYLIMPQGSVHKFPGPKVVASGSTVRSMAGEVVILPPEA
ncbi:MAG: hypothetical protein WBV71_16565 [Roseobacter sp.]